jgi:hypothetical protein
MANGGGARPESERGRGFRWPEVVVRAWGAVGKGVALERGAGEEWVMEERTGVQAHFERPVSGAAEREKGGRGGSGHGSAMRCGGGVVGPGQDRRATPGSGPSAARTGDVRRASVAGRKQRGGD